ncbi:hypothetical protein RB598_009858 [Gaeumannomyces tritici]
MTSVWLWRGSPPLGNTGLAVAKFLRCSAFAAALLLTALVLKCIYNLTLHPLARFPGPFLCRATRLAYCRRLVSGRLPFEILDLHKKYGDVVRIAPDELSFAHPTAWLEIYGHRPHGSDGPEELPKYQTYFRNAGMPPSIVNEDRENHALIRRLLAPGFSERTMRDQEPIIGGYVDLLIKQLHANCSVPDSNQDQDAASPVSLDSGDGAAGARPLRNRRPKTSSAGHETGDGRKMIIMSNWLTWTTFDIIGDLVFGEPFGCLARGRYDPWVSQINHAGPATAYIWTLKYLGLDVVVLPVAMAWMRRQRLARETTAKLRRRMELGADGRPDLIGGLLRKQSDWNLEYWRIRVNVGTLVLAGSETTATLLCGVTFLLVSHPPALERLAAEVRSAFSSQADITMLSVARLPYMLACLNEALRAYPPAAVGLPRVVPPGGATVAGEYLPAGTACAVWQWATYHNDKYFKDPFGFHPERFMNHPDFADDNLDMFQPFSFGPRNCIGKNLAYAEMRLVLAKLVFNFDMTAVEDTQGWMDQKAYIMWAKKPLNVYLTPAVRV